MKLFHVGPQYFWCVVVRINANGIKKDILAYAVTQLLLYLRQARRFQRTCVVARGVNEIDGNDLAFDQDRKSTRLNSSHTVISYAVFCLKKKNNDATL